MAVLSGSCFAHDLATFNRLLLAGWHAAMTVRLKVLDRKWVIMMYVCIKGQHHSVALVVLAERPHGDHHESDARGLWDV
jgi:hypothetical protein